jgi:hypothetical protein
LGFFSLLKYVWYKQKAIAVAVSPVVDWLFRRPQAIVEMRRALQVGMKEEPKYSELIIFVFYIINCFLT